MNLFALIVSLIFLVGVGLAVLVGIMRGRRYKWQVSLGRLISVVVATVASAFLAAFLSNLIISSVLTSILENGTLGDLGDIFGSLPSGVAAVSVLGSMFVAPILFIPLFAIIKVILSLISKLVTKKIFEIMEKKGKSTMPKKALKPVVRKRVKLKEKILIAPYQNILGATLGAVASVLVLLVFLVPVVGNAEVIGGAAPMILEGEALEVVDGVSDNAATFTVKYTGGKLLYGVMTKGELNGEKINLNKEGAFFASLANAIANNGDKTPEQKAEAIRDISPAFDDTVISRTLVTELCVAAGDDWKAGDDYYGIGRPSLGKGLKSLSVAMVDVLATTDTEYIKGDLKAITHAIAAVVEKDLAKDIDDNPTIIISDEEATSKIFGALLTDQRHVPIVDALSDYGISMLMDSLKTPTIREVVYIDFVEEFISTHAIDHATLAEGYRAVFEKYGIRVSDGTISNAVSAYFAEVDMLQWVANNIAATPEEFAQKTEIVSKEMIVDGVATVSDPEKEADALAHAFAVSYGISNELKSESFVAKEMLVKMGPALDSFAATETVGKEKTGIMLKAMLQSELIGKQIGFSVLEATDTAISIQENSSNGSYASIMTSLSGVIDMLEASSSADRDTREAVNKMLANLSPEGASVMQTMASANVMKNYGVPERSAASSATMIKNTFANLQNTPSEQYSGEAAALTDMMNMMMSIPKNAEEDTRATFGAEGTTRVSESEYVNNIMSSSAMSQAAVDTVYAGRTFPTTDPLNSQRKLSDTEKANLLTSLNESWSSSDKSEQSKKEIISTAALMNLEVEIVSDKVAVFIPVEPTPWQ